jgi:hypothetical protein
MTLLLSAFLVNPRISLLNPSSFLCLYSLSPLWGLHGPFSSPYGGRPPCAGHNCFPGHRWRRASGGIGVLLTLSPGILDMGKNYRNSDFHQEFRCPRGKFLIHPVPGDAPFGKKLHNPSFSRNPKHSQNGETIGDGFGFENGIHSPDGRPKKRMPEDKTVHHSHNRIGRRGITRKGSKHRDGW